MLKKSIKQLSFIKHLLYGRNYFKYLNFLSSNMF